MCVDTLHKGENDYGDDGDDDDDDNNNNNNNNNNNIRRQGSYGHICSSKQASIHHAELHEKQLVYLELYVWKIISSQF
jgi:hypothetical protein